MVQYFFFAVLLTLLWQIIRILSPFYVALIGSAILAMLIHPLHEWVLRRLPRIPSIVAGASTVFVVLLVILPLSLLAWNAIREATKVYPVVQRWVTETPLLQGTVDLSDFPPQVTALWERSSKLFDQWHIEPQRILLQNVDSLGKQVTRLTTGAIKNTFFLIFNLLVLAFTLFFFLRDGPFIIQRTVELIPMAPENKEAVMHRLQVTLYAVVRGVLVVAILQGALAGLGFWMFGVPFPVLLGMITCFLGVIPFIGPASVWLPVVVGLGVSGLYQQAILVFLWGTLVVSVVDNFLRPLLISSDAKLPVLLLFFGLVGGLRLYGFAGLLIGPVIIALGLAFINIYRREYHWLLSPVTEPEV